MEAAQYNHKVSLERMERLASEEKQPMGDLFEKRKIQKPIMSPRQMADGIHEQVFPYLLIKIIAKRERNEKANSLNALQDKLVCEKLRKE